MNAHTPILTPLALQNADVLRALADHVFGVETSKVWTSTKALAEHLGRDDSNLGKSLRALHEAGLIYQPASWHGLTDLGQTVLAALNRAEGIGLPPPVPDAVNAAGVLVAHERIIPDGLNPRKHFDEAEVAELADSIARDDLLENLVIRPAETDAQGGGPFHRLVAGERRWRAIKLLIADGRWPKGKGVPCKVVDIDDAAHRRIALVENLQRKDLRPIDEAKALQDLMELTGSGTAEIAKDIGFTQRFVQQRLQLLQLPAIQQVALNEGRMTVEAARQWIAQQPVPLTPAEQLVLAEWMEKAKTDPVEYHALSVEVRATTVREEKDGYTKVSNKIGDPIVAQLIKRSVFDEPRQLMIERTETGRHHLPLRSYFGDKAVKELLPSAVDGRKRKTLIAKLRAELLGEAAAEIPEGTYATAWLNGPFETPPEILAEIETRRTAREEEEARRVEAQEAAEQVRADTRRAAEGRLRRAAEVEPELRRAAGDVLTQPLAALADELGVSLPLSISEAGRIVDAEGVEIVDAGYWGQSLDLLARRRFMVAVINSAAGYPTPTATAPSSDELDDIDVDDAEDEA